MAKKIKTIFSFKIIRIVKLCLLVSYIPVYASVSHGPYLGIELGASNQTINFNSENFNLNTNGVNLINSSVGIASRFNLGYGIDKYNGFELGTTYNFGFSHTYPNNQGMLNEALWNEDLSYILSIPTVVENLSIFARGGLGYAWNGSNSGCSCKQSISINGFTDVIGAGVKYRLSAQSLIRVEWIANGLFFPVSVSNGSSNIGLLTNNNFEVGINYYF